MYHYVSPLPEEADDIRIDLTIEPPLFRAHMQYLKEAGYQTISLADLDNALLHGTSLPLKPIILTFDDGYVDHYATVFPLLKEYGFSGTFFVITGRADENNPDYLNWAQITEMAEAGMLVESHTKNHADLRDRDRDFLVYEMLGSFESLAAHLGHPTQMFSYPAGQYDDLTLQIASELAIQRAVTTQPGMFHTTDNRLEMPRVRVHGGTTAAGLEYLLHGDWLTP